MIFERRVRPALSFIKSEERHASEKQSVGEQTIESDTRTAADRQVSPKQSFKIGHHSHSISSKPAEAAILNRARLDNDQ
ncbi:hypothetical protein [Burkholderia pyrrocinia]|uniref:hypothetical protein n=1 Tax=Burkholderia pyrrocinia TaxID=60550 RepID=UPI0015886BBF|nr:hypothetical protein [Burkholderia pyrrocinia]